MEDMGASIAELRVVLKLLSRSVTFKRHHSLKFLSVPKNSSDVVSWILNNVFGALLPR